jgi:hypothetical protein
MRDLKELGDEPFRPCAKCEFRGRACQGETLEIKELLRDFTLHEVLPWDKILATGKSLHFRRKLREVRELPGSVEFYVFWDPVYQLWVAVVL